MILSDKSILTAIEDKSIVIKPFNINCLGSNSYDVHLSEHMACYEDKFLSARRHNKIKHFDIGDEGLILIPGTLYLGSTMEYTETHSHVPVLEGKSSTGRLGINIHATAGKGDVGFCGHWTLEISVIHPVQVFKGMPIGQLIYFPVLGEIETPYNKKESAKYAQQHGLPVESMMFKNSF